LSDLLEFVGISLAGAVAVGLVLGLLVKHIVERVPARMARDPKLVESIATANWDIASGDTIRLDELPRVLAECRPNS